MEDGEEAELLISDSGLSTVPGEQFCYIVLIFPGILRVKWERETLQIIFVLKEPIWLRTQQDVLLPGVEAILPFNYMLMTIQLFCKGIRSMGTLWLEDVILSAVEP